MKTAHGDSGLWERFLVTTSGLLLQPPPGSCGTECGSPSNLRCPEGVSLKELFRHHSGCPTKAKQYAVWLGKCAWISLSPGVTSQGLEELSPGLAQVAEEWVTPHSTVWPPARNVGSLCWGLGMTSHQRSKQAQEDIKGTRWKIWTSQLSRRDFWGDSLVETHQVCLAQLHDARPIGDLSSPLR